MNLQVQLKIFGRVQGVFYRSSAKKEAEKLGLTGWIKNAPDGTVEAFAQGPSAALQIFIEWCNDGPQAAEVEDMEVKFEPESQEKFPDFSILKDPI